MQRRLRTNDPVVLRAWLPAGFVILLVFLMGLGYGFYTNVQRIIEQSTWARHTVEVQRTIEEVQAAMNAAENYQRGYLLSGKESLAKLSADESAEAIRASVYLIQLVRDNPVQGKRSTALKTAVEGRLSRLREVLRIAQTSGLENGRALVSVVGPELSERVRLLCTEMLTEEKGLLQQRDKMREQSIQVTMASLAISAVVTLGLLTSLYSMLRRFLFDQEQARRSAEEHRQALQIEVFEKERAERELQRSNRELQDFAFVASHDLQEPLRKIQAFGDRLRSKNETILDETSLDYLARMQNAANRMQELINALLNLSRITTKAQPFVKVPLEPILAGVVEDLQARIEESGAQVVVYKLPAIQADRIQMRQLFQNLIGNALKFRAENRPIRVEVREVPSKAADTVRIEVKDNGIGFETRHAEKIFAIFQRLHGRGEYEGSGIGLAVCRRIVDRHGGSITAESVPGEGATFIIELPTKQAESKE